MMLVKQAERIMGNRGGRSKKEGILWLLLNSLSESLK